jgi:hypothetical protein
VIYPRGDGIERLKYALDLRLHVRAERLAAFFVDLDGL